MKPNLIDIGSINKDLSEFHFNNTSFTINLITGAILVFSMYCAFYLFKSPCSKKQQKEIIRHKLNYILTKTNLQLQNKEN